MADFWQRLAARSLGETPRVEPAIAPLYASGRLLAQSLEQAEDIQDTVSFNTDPVPILASQLVKLSPTSPFAELTRSPQPSESQLINSQSVENQPAKNSSQPDQTTARIEPEQRSIQPDHSAVDRELMPRRIDPIAQKQPIAPEPIAPAQTSLSMRSSSLVPISRSATSIPLINPQISSPATLTSVQLPKDSTNQSSVPSLPPIAIAPLPPTVQPQIAQPQTAQPDTEQPADRPDPESVQPIPPPQITPLIRRAEATEAIAESNRRSLPSVALPTIQVTIGRIEIRATPPVANRSKPPRSAPQLSLQDYLKQQGGKP